MEQWRLNIGMFITRQSKGIVMAGDGPEGRKKQLPLTP